MKSIFAVLLLMGLAMGCSSNSSKTETASSSSPAQAAATPDSSAASPELKAISLAMQGKKWARLEHEDKMDGHKWVSFTMYPLDYVSKDPLDNTHIEVWCEKSQLSMAIKTAPRSDGAVRIRFDDGPVVSQTWHKTEGDWFPGAVGDKVIINGMATAKLFKYEFNAVDKPHEVLNFNMADYRESVLADPLCKK